MSESRLAVRDLCKHFAGVYALKGVSLDFLPGEVHALLGENGAGKSTLCKLLSGAHSPDGGTIIIGENEFTKLTPHLAKENGIGMIYQEFNLVPDMMVYENLFLGKEIRKGVDSNRSAMIAKTNEVFSDLGVQVDPKAKIMDLSVAYCQLVEIGKAVLENAKYLIMDEPTAALTNLEVDALFSLMGRLKAKGVTIIYISHRISELMEFTDKITVMRDGELIDTLATKEANADELIRLMVGRKLGTAFPELHFDARQDKVLLKVENLTTNVIKNISFELHAGEILGLAGLVGAGRTETLRVIFGADPILSGKVFIRGEGVKVKSPQDGIHAGIAMIPEDRKREGVHLDLPIATNISMIRIKDFTKLFTILKSKENILIDKYIKTLSIKLSSIWANVSSLSGGNQQKVAVSKWMSIESDIMFFDEPTRGIDVAAKKEIYELMDSLRMQGKGIIMVSSEMSEIIGMCNRIIVLYEGEQKGELRGGDVKQEQIMELASDIVKSDAVS